MVAPRLTMAVTEYSGTCINGHPLVCKEKTTS